MKIHTVCFDMDGTLIRNTDSVKYLCELSDAMVHFHEINTIKSSGKINWVEADHHKASYMKGLDVGRVAAEFDNHIKLIDNIDPVLDYLKEKQIPAILVTAGPVQVADVIGKRFGFDAVFGSLYEENGNKFTGRITHHLESHGKLICLKNFCEDNGFEIKHCAAVGDGDADIDIFNACGKSIAINASPMAKEAASETIVTEDFADVLGFFRDWIGD